MTHTADRTVLDLSDFASGWGGWEFHYWFPNGRRASAEIVGASVVIRTAGDAREGDGLAFLQRRLPAAPGALIGDALVSWWAPEPVLSPDPWQHIAYLGPSRPLDGQEALSRFHTFRNGEGLIPGTSGKATAMRFESSFDPRLDELQICLGWRISGPAEGEARISRILVEASERSADVDAEAEVARLQPQHV